MKNARRIKRQTLRFALAFTATILLVACSSQVREYRGTCAQQTQQFLDHVRTLVTDELTPVIRDGFHAGSSPVVIKSIEELDARVSKLSTPACNPSTTAAKEALRLYLLETRNYFSTVAGRAVYGEGQVQAHLSKMYEAGLAFELALIEVQK